MKYEFIEIIVLVVCIATLIIGSAIIAKVVFESDMPLWLKFFLLY